MRRKEPISVVAVLVGLLAIALFWNEAGHHLVQLVEDGTFKDSDYAIRQIFTGIIVGGLVGSFSIGLQYLADVRWLLRNGNRQDA